MQTFDLEQAANFLKCGDDHVRELAASGELPAAKVGRAWVFVDVDLIEWLRSQYTARKQGKSCHSISAVKRGGSISPMTDKELDDLLTPATSPSRKKSTTSLKLISERKNPAAKP